MNEYDPGWKPYKEYSAFDEATRDGSMMEMFRSMMDDANEYGGEVFVMCSQVIQRDGDHALYTPEFEGELVGVKEGDEENYLLLKDVNVMQQADSDDAEEVLTYTTLERHQTMRIAISSIANVIGGSARFGNDYEP